MAAVGNRDRRPLKHSDRLWAVQMQNRVPHRLLGRSARYAFLCTEARREGTRILLKPTATLCLAAAVAVLRVLKGRRVFTRCAAARRRTVTTQHSAQRRQRRQRRADSSVCESKPAPSAVYALLRTFSLSPPF